MAESQAPVQNPSFQKTSSDPNLLEYPATFLGADGTWKNGIRCGTPSPTREEAQRVRKALDRFFMQKREAREKALVIPVAFHVVRHSDGYADVTDLQINSQIDVLNDAYRDVGYQFFLQSVNRVDNTNWSTSSQFEIPMKKALAITSSLHLEYLHMRSFKRDCLDILTCLTPMTKTAL